MTRKLYPVGIQTFEEIIRRNLFYVDKTEYVYRMTHTSGGKYFFLSRPRRFGKSLLVSTLRSYFEGRRDLFEGLAIDRLEQEWMQYPVLHFSMAGGKHLEKADLEKYLCYLLEPYERKYGVAHPKDGTNNRLTDLISSAYQKTGRQVVVLIDEYDAPLLDVVHEESTLPELRDIMRNFYSPLKDCEPMLRFVFLTGITKFSQLSIFSELNNIADISMDPAYAGICGITKEEMLTQMDNDIRLLAEKRGITFEQTVDKLKDNYDGYHFTWPSPDIFNPYSLLNCMADGRFSHYWFGSGTPTYLINMMRKFSVLPSQLDNVRAKSSSFDAATETMTSLTPLLYQSGYVTIKDYDEETDVYTLGFPNKEIEVGLFDCLLPGYLHTAIDAGRVAVADMSVMLKRGKLEEALKLLRDFLHTVPYCDNTNYEGHYQQMFYIIFALLTAYSITVEAHTPRGRVDTVIETHEHIYVIEMKFNRSAEEALSQINSRRYAEAFAMKGKQVVKAGLNFSQGNDGNTLEWAIEQG